ncbi:diacylglycerol/lipid kinase family protein [Maribacter sp. 2307ULW6-5]|uniref:diacylglycerol/lipid kinase family protein n=1 Tax=Maribacter sp. 2307ULW6-5 TaxID=3386275 RepID=UPI0039BD7E9C
MTLKKKMVLAVVNPVSGNVDKAPLVQELRRSLPAQHDLELFETTGKGDGALLRKRVNQLSPDRVLVIGGDGTLHLAATVVRHRQVVMGLVPAGSTNGFAHELGLPAQPGDALKVALGENLMEVDALMVNAHLVLHTADLGLNAELVQRYDDGSVRGRLGYLLQSVPTLLETQAPYKFQIAAHGRVVEREGIMIVCTHCRHFGTGVEINPKGVINDGFFELLLFKKLNMVQIISTLLGNIPMDHDFVERIRAKEAIVGVNEKVALQTDGEPREPTAKINVKSLERAFTFAVGGQDGLAGNGQ